jgi:transcription antitermination factor NusG
MRSLTKAGFECWTPVETVTREVVKFNVKRKIEVAMIPSYVFARADRLLDLIALANDPGREHREFRVFKQSDRFPLIADETLAPIRAIEQRRKPRGKVATVKVGAKVRLNERGFEGLDGVVQSVSNKHAMVQFVGFPVPVKIGCWLIADGIDASNDVQVECRQDKRASRHRNVA